MRLWQWFVGGVKKATWKVEIFVNKGIGLLFKKLYRDRILGRKVQALENQLKARQQKNEQISLKHRSDRIRQLMATAEKIKVAKTHHALAPPPEAADLAARSISLHSFSSIGGALKIFEESRACVLSESLREKLKLLDDAQKEVRELEAAVSHGLYLLHEIDPADVEQADDERLNTLAKLKVMLGEVKRRTHLVDAALADFPILQKFMFTQRETLQEETDLLQSELSSLS